MIQHPQSKCSKSIECRRAKVETTKINQKLGNRTGFDPLSDVVPMLYQTFGNCILANLRSAFFNIPSNVVKILILLVGY